MAKEAVPEWKKFFSQQGFMQVSEMPSITESIIPTPSPSLNWTLGSGGFVEGKWIVFYGPESGGKSLLEQVIMAQIQRKYKDALCILFDTEFTLSKEWFSVLGGDPSRLFLKQTNNPEDIFDWIETVLGPQLDAGLPVKCIGIDSIAAIRFPKDQWKGDRQRLTTENVMGGTGASYLPTAFKAILPTLKKNQITTIMVQQVREEMDIYKKLANPWTIPDGRALKHFSEYLLLVEKLETKDNLLKDPNTGLVRGHRIRVKCKKNKAGAPHRVAEFNLDYQRGIVDTEKEIYDLGKMVGVIRHPVKDGKENVQLWELEGHPPIRGEEAFAKWVMENPNVQEHILEACNRIIPSSTLDTASDA